jgi:hypothetical protein
MNPVGLNISATSEGETMNSRNTRIADYVNGDKALPATFTTAYKRDLDVARQIIQQRRHGVAAAPARKNTENRPDATDVGRPQPA